MSSPKPKTSHLGRRKSYLNMKTGAVFAAFLCLTVYGLYELLMGSCGAEMCGRLVWWYGWLTAASTGLGVVPFLFVTDMSDRWLGVCNGNAPLICRREGGLRAWRGSLWAPCARVTRQRSHLLLCVSPHSHRLRYDGVC